ncbi:hypothetical protein NST11_17430 [Caldifermentibacillus hisashii]|uniref:hypothetical protein n=1 Tax=Caldifermentibacillus hisashii TaxID=996558 RepID=UPI0031B79CE5
MFKGKSCGVKSLQDFFLGTNPFGVGGVTVADKIAPKLASTDPIQTVDADGNGKIDHIRIEFTEAIDNNYLSATTFSVAGYTVTAAATDTDGAVATATAKGDGTNSKYVLLTVAEKTTPDTDATPNVQRVGTVKDVNGNEFTGLTAATASVDKAAPVLLSAVGANGSDEVTLTFSEPVYGGTASALADLATSDFTFTAGATVATIDSIVSTTKQGVTSLVIKMSAALATEDLDADLHY